MELRLLNSLTSKEVYTECAGILTPDIFSSDLEDVMIAIQELHSKFDEDIDMDIVKEHIHNKKVSTTAKKALLDDFTVMKAVITAYGEMITGGAGKN